jgi:hypothetical protein
VRRSHGVLPGARRRSHREGQEGKIATRRGWGVGDVHDFGLRTTPNLVLHQTWAAFSSRATQGICSGPDR